VTSPLAALLGTVLERALAAAVALDPGTAEGLRALAGRRVTIVLDPPGVALTLSVKAEGRLRVEPEAEAAELRLAASPGALLSRLLKTPLAPGALRISGDVELARTLERLLSGYEPELERPFVALFGELLGPRVARLARALLELLAAQARAFAEDLRDWALDREGVAVPRAEAEALYAEIEGLRDAVERAEKRLDRLAAALGDAADGGPGG
jgi:ubiquinone biosynthesis protein UbiJ